MSNHQNQQQQHQQHGSGLTRYRSAPSSYFSNLLNTNTNGFGPDDFDQLFDPQEETHRIYSTFSASNSDTVLLEQNRYVSQSQPHFLPTNTEPLVHQQPQPQQQQLQRQQSNDYSSVSHQAMYSGSGSLPENSYTPSLKMESTAGGGNSGLIRHSSSPAGLFANIDIEKEFGAMRGMGGFGAGTSSNAGPPFTSTSRFKNHQMASIPEMESKTTRQDNRPSSNKQIGEASVDDAGYIPGFHMSAWDDSAMFSDSFLNGLADDENKVFPNTSSSSDQNVEGGSQQRIRLAHHMSMPTSSAELSAMEQILQDSVPCKLRAKRGFATHPRSIAERVRRTKISDRMRRLQELVPNMEKQTNTSDMLDLAVDYIKDLQNQVKKLSDTKQKCSCLPKEKS